MLKSLVLRLFFGCWLFGPSLLLTAAEPLDFRKLFRQTQPSQQIADEALVLKAEHGPWLIIAASLEGEQAQSLAIELARELRQKHHLASYVLPKQFDYSQTVPGSGIEPNGRQRRMRHMHDERIDSYGVLIGDFSSLDDPSLKETLQQVKQLFPETLAKQTESANSVSAFKKLMRSADQSAKPPMATAFVTRNPLLPEDFFQTPAVDSFVYKLNKNADHSLLKAKGRFTVRVATFRGADAVVLQNSRTAQQATEKGATDQLEFAVVQANLMANVLRDAGFDAFEFHDRNSSIVTVGSFDSLGNEDKAGKFIYALEIQEVQKKFGGIKEYQNSQYGMVPAAKTLLDIVNPGQISALQKGSTSEKKANFIRHAIPFDLDPKPMAIPRQETSKLYSNSLLGKN
jgi:hypothetical protein